MRNFLVPHSTQMDRVAGRPFFMQKISTAPDGVVIVLNFWTENGGGNCTSRTRLPVWSVANDSHFHDTCRLRRHGRGRYNGFTAAGGAADEPPSARSGLTGWVVLLSPTRLSSTAVPA